jgi:MATE family multidrug resistance protein
VTQTNVQTAPPPPASLGRLLSLAWPIVISRSSQVVVGVCDALMVTHLGQAALAATTTGGFNTFTVFILPMGIVFIVSSFASQLHGAGDGAGARRYGFYGLAMALATQLGATAALPFVPGLLGHFDYTPEVRALMASYLQIRLLSSGPAIGIEALANYYGGVGNTRLPMLASLGAMVLNVLGCWLFISGHLGAPALGVNGSALAATLATVIAFLGLFGCFLAGVGVPGGRAPSRLHLGELGRMLRFGISSGLNWFFEFLAFSFFINVVITGLGTATLAAMMTVFQINSVSFMPGFAVASAGAILVGHAIGAGAPDQVPRTLRLTLAVAASWQVPVALAYIVAPRLLLAPFSSPSVDAEVFLAAGTRILFLSAGWQLFDATASCVAEALRATGDTAFVLWARLVIAWLIFVPGTLVTTRAFGGGDVAATAWVVAYLGLLAAALLVRFRSGAWRRIQLTETG